MGFFSKLFGKGDETKTETPRGMSKDDALSAYVVREHKQGRSLEDILDDPYLKNRATDEQRLRLRLVFPGCLETIDGAGEIGLDHVRRTAVVAGVHGRLGRTFDQNVKRAGVAEIEW